MESNDQSHPGKTTRELYHDHVLSSYGRFDLEIVKGAGARVWDETGREYLDFGAGIAVCSLGHCHPEVTAAVTRQAATLVHCSNLYYTRPQAELAAELSRLLGLGGRFFFCNSGAEANEGLIKLARRFGNATGGRTRILTFAGSFHGRTMAGISATGQDKVKTGFAPLLEGFTHLPYGSLDAVASALEPDVCAILLEPVQGEGGIHPASADFLRGLRQLADEKKVLLLYDEVQCGLGRTGDWCAWRTIAGHDAEPDAASWAKGIANGYPLGAFWVSDRTRPGCEGPLHGLLGPGSHGTTYGGNPVCCAAAAAVLEIIERDNLAARAAGEGNFLADGIRGTGSQDVAGVRQIGLMLGIELAEGYPTRHPQPGGGPSAPSLHFTRRAMDAGLLVIPSGERVVRLLPPLNISREESAAALDILRGLLLPESA